MEMVHGRVSVDNLQEEDSLRRSLARRGRHTPVPDHIGVAGRKDPLRMPGDHKPD